MLNTNQSINTNTSVKTANKINWFQEFLQKSLYNNLTLALLSSILDLFFDDSGGLSGVLILCGWYLSLYFSYLSLSPGEADNLWKKEEKNMNKGLQWVQHDITRTRWRRILPAPDLLQSSLTGKLKLIRGNPLEPLKQSFQRKFIDK